ncbi:hypothetical protein [Actinomadura macrotermitis]|uniref:Uncharacterized protein n=1 Tax=Actinomadura macrotermitis TaxID=2585200 RepID=A0A7K0BLF6_9ACTN|nr:hypothetical protein [Actinomadura macrotermitis]MQY02018.1 hypothetical protein [Actinomadura macrotermitis]
MPATVSFIVPEQVTASFVVATGQPDVPAAILSALAPDLAAEAARRLGTPRLTITSHPVDRSPWCPPPGGAAGTLRHIGVGATLPAGDQPLGARLARALARVIAEHSAGVAVDLDNARILPDRPEPRRFALADGWLGARRPPGRGPEHCTAGAEEVDGCACVELTTQGLHRFGLPELRISGVACAHDLAALNILRATAQRLLPLGARPGVHVIPRELPLTGTDFAAYWGDREPLWDDDPVPVRLTSLSPRLLSVSSPSRFPGTLNQWLWDELPPPLYDTGPQDGVLAPAPA